MSALAMEQAASSAIDQIAARQIRLAGLVAQLRHRGGDAVLHFGRQNIGEGVAEVLDDVQPVSAANHTQPDHVIGRVEQVRAMRRGKHEMLVRSGGVEIERDVFAFLIELQARGRRQTFGEGGLTVKLMRKLARGDHFLRMSAGGLR